MIGSCFASLPSYFYNSFPKIREHTQPIFFLPLIPEFFSQLYSILEIHCEQRTPFTGGHYYSKWFKTYKEKCNIFESSRVFHSFRNLAAVKFKPLDVPEHIVSNILGHKVPGMSFGHYSGPGSVQKMSKAIEQLNFNRYEDLFT